MSEALTAGQLILALSKLDPDTVIHWQESDSGYGYWYDWSIGGVTDDGLLLCGEIIGSGDYEDLEDDDDSWMQG